MTADDGSDAQAYGPQGRSAWLDVDWREHRRWVCVEERWANVVELGAGPAVVFVHGLGGSWQNWLENLPEIARSHRAVAMDLPGFGESEMPREEISISGYGHWLCSLLDELGIERATLVGNSMGGFVAAETAIRHPERVERLVLVSAAGISAEHQRSDRGIDVLRRTQSLTGLVMSWWVARAEWLARRPRLRKASMWAVVKHPDRLPAPLFAEQLRGAGKPGFLDALDALTSYPLRDRLEQISCPTLVVWGSDDHLVPLRDASTFEELIPDARKVVFADTGHVAMLERPARFNRLLEDFLAERPGEEVDETSRAAGPASGEEAEAVRASEAQASGEG